MTTADVTVTPDTVPDQPQNSAGPAYRIETERTVLRCWRPQDAPLIMEAIEKSVDHLRDWLPWAANEPTSLEDKIALLRRWRAQFDLDEDYTYGIFSPDEKAVWGGSGLHKRLSGSALEIGYWVRVDLINRGLATEVSAALSRVAFAVNSVERVEIHCDPANVRSAAIPRKLGFKQEELVRCSAETTQGPTRATKIWTLSRQEHRKTPVADAQITAYNVTGNEILLT